VQGSKKSLKSAAALKSISEICVWLIRQYYVRRGRFCGAKILFSSNKNFWHGWQEQELKKIKGKKSASDFIILE
jgi:hypothetical protein